MDFKCLFHQKIVTALLVCAVLQNSELSPLPGPRPQDMWSNVNSQDHTEEDAFMIAKSVTQEEIEEFHRLSMIYHFYLIFIEKST